MRLPWRSDCRCDAAIVTIALEPRLAGAITGVLPAHPVPGACTCPGYTLGTRSVTPAPLQHRCSGAWSCPWGSASQPALAGWLPASPASQPVSVGDGLAGCQPASWLAGRTRDRIEAGLAGLAWLAWPGSLAGWQGLAWPGLAWPGRPGGLP